MQVPTTPHDAPPPALTGDLEVDTAAALAWLYDHPEYWLGAENDEAGRGANGGRSAA